MFEHMSIENFIQIYTWIAVISTVLFVLKLAIFAFIGGDTEVETTFTTEIDTDASFDFLSVQSILAFFMGFGWSGIASINEWNLSMLWTTIISILTGAIFLFASSYLMWSLKKLNNVITFDLQKCVGQKGQAYTNIQPLSVGQVEIEIGGKLSIVSAKNLSEELIESFTPIRVEKVENDVIYVVKDKE